MVFLWFSYGFPMVILSLATFGLLPLGTPNRLQGPADGGQRGVGQVLLQPDSLLSSIVSGGFSNDSRDNLWVIYG